MAWSKNPLIYPRIFHDLLEAANEGRDKITWIASAGKNMGKYKFQFYAFKAAWEAKADRSRRLQNFELAAQEDANSAKLGRYTPIVGIDRITFVNKEVVILEEGIRAEISGDIKEDAHETLDLVAQVEGSQERLLAEKAEHKGKRKGLPLPSSAPGPLSPAAIVAARTSTAIEKHFGSIERETEPVPVPSTPEELEMLEIIRREQEDSGDKHG